MNDYTAKNGLKTFVLTLGVSLLFFGVLYFLLNTSSTKDSSDIDSEVKNTEISANVQPDTAPQDDVTPPSVFQEIAKTKPNVQARAVLAGATEATQSTVPQTGTTEMTLAFMVSVTALSFGLYMVARGPRKTALASFEDDVTRTLR